MAIICYILVAYISIFIHELGHYLSAYLFGIKATDVIIGMGFKLISFKTKYTTFTFNIIPGGGVTIYPPYEDRKLSRFKQFIVLGAGVTFNYIAATLATMLYFKTNILSAFILFNDMIKNFIETLFTLFSVHTILAPQVSMTESIGIISNQFTTSHFFIFVFIFMNLLLFLFNILPIPFFDGGQMLALYIDPIFYKLGVTETTLEKLKVAINHLVGVALVLIACIPLINELSHFINNKSLSTREMIKYSIIIIGAILIKRLFTARIKRYKARNK